MAPYFTREVFKLINFLCNKFPDLMYEKLLKLVSFSTDVFRKSEGVYALLKDGLWMTIIQLNYENFTIKMYLESQLTRALYATTGVTAAQLCGMHVTAEVTRRPRPAVRRAFLSRL